LFKTNVLTILTFILNLKIKNELLKAPSISDIKKALPGDQSLNIIIHGVSFA